MWYNVDKLDGVIEMSDSKFESRLREERISKGISQEELARKVNVSRETIRNIENGAAVPNVLLALSIGAILGVGVGLLFAPKKKGGENDE